MKRYIPLLALTAIVSFAIGQFTQFPVALAATPTTDQLLSQIQTLQSRVTAIEGTSRTTSTASATETALAALQAKVDNMASVLQVTQGNVLLKTAGDISIEAAGKVSTKAGMTYAVNAASTVNITGVGTTTLNGSFVRLNNGNKAVSHQNGVSATVFVP